MIAATSGSTAAVNQITRIIFWQPVDSPHQDEFLEAVAELFTGEVVLGVERPFPAELAAQGWRAPEHRLVRVVDLSRPENCAALVAHAAADTLHVFSGYFSHPLVWAAFRTLAPSPARLAIYSEAPQQPPFTGWLKRLRARLLASRWSDRFSFVLAIGGVGRDFFAAAGFPGEKIVPFGYYLATARQPAVAPVTGPVAGGRFRFVSAGQLIRRKGVDLLVEACASLPHAAWQVDVYGDGPERAALARLAASRGLHDRMAFHGTIPNADLQRVLAAADCVVLPSRFDGWGMLVSESLAAGTPAICTDRCGSADLIRAAAPAARPVGRVVTAAAGPLSAALAAALAAGPPTDDQRHRCRSLASSAGSPSAAALVFLDAAGGPPARVTPRPGPAFLLA
jgi:glycosyltransferase involved in cell wall biosynthesis